MKKGILWWTDVKDVSENNFMNGSPSETKSEISEESTAIAHFTFIFLKHEIVFCLNSCLLKSYTHFLLTYVHAMVC